jgi:hypothetical protein
VTKSLVTRFENKKELVMIAKVRVRATRILLAVAGVAAVSIPTSAMAQSAICGPEIKQQVADALSKATDDASKFALEKELYEKYQFCIADSQSAPSTFFVAARECGAAVSNLGSLFFEEMSCSGYDPQRRQFASPIKIKQPFGFGGAPLPGSREYVLHCVADAAGVLQPVGRDSVHLADSPNGAPTWQFATIVSATENLYTVYPMDGSTRRARSILSWNLRPTDCNYTPIWGNALNYRIRLDQ